MKAKMTITNNLMDYGKLSDKFSDEIAKMVDDWATDTENEAVSEVRKDLGDLAQSAYRVVGDTSATVGFNAHYAPYVEFGTGGKVDVPSGLEDYAIDFIGAGIKQVNLTPRPFLFPAWKSNGIKLMDKLNKMLNGS